MNPTKKLPTCVCPVCGLTVPIVKNDQEPCVSSHRNRDTRQVCVGSMVPLTEFTEKPVIIPA
jgi:hypothetical protein